MIFAIDAMGGDYAPAEIVKGALSSANNNKDDEYLLIGDETVIKKIINISAENVKIIHTDEYITMDEKPSEAVKKKKRSTMKIAAELIKDKKCDALISAGNTGALLETSTLIIGRIKGIKRPALATFFPTKKGSGILIDSGANPECKPEYLLQFAKMGSIYLKTVQQNSNPSIGLINIGSEEGKGNSFYKTVYDLMNNDESFNFVGNIEPRDLMSGKADVAVADGFVGNIVLKSAEAAADLLQSILRDEIKKSIVAKVTALTFKPIFKNVKKRLDHSEHGGALLIGLKGICIKSHGRADSKAVFNAIQLAKTVYSHNMIGQLEKMANKDS